MQKSGLKSKKKLHWVERSNPFGIHFQALVDDPKKFAPNHLASVYTYRGYVCYNIGLSQMTMRTKTIAAAKKAVEKFFKSIGATIQEST